MLIVALSSLEAMACSLKGKRFVASTYDALRGNLFYALFDTSGEFPQRLSEDKLISKEEFMESIPKETFIIGDGISVIEEDLMKKEFKYDISIKRPDAKDFYSLGLARYGNKDYMRNLFVLEPKYLQESAAIRKRTENKGE